MTAGDAVSAVVSTKITKAEKFMAVADVAVAADHHDAAVSLAVSAGVNYVDALCLQRLGRRAGRSEGHEDALGLLRKCGGVGDTVARHYRRLLRNKTKAQYSAQECTDREASETIQHAERIRNLVRDDIGLR